MKKIFFIIIMVISTCLTSYAIMFWQPSDKTMSENKVEKQDVEKLNSEANKTYNLINDEIDGEKNGYEEEKKINENEIGSLSTKENKSLDITVQGSILKIDEKELENRITREKKEKIERIIKNISEVDLINIKEKFNKEDKLEGFREGFALIKRRLSVKEYEEIKEILSEYIDFTILEIEI